jgi:hypothetical protein
MRYLGKVTEQTKAVSAGNLIDTDFNPDCVTPAGSQFKYAG